jgi:F0F1-type ATP synthase membrane subunit a
MLDSILSHYKFYCPLLIGLFLLLKVFLFFSYKNKGWGFAHFLYFSHVNIELSHDAKRERIKKIQNALSIGIIVTLIIFIFFLNLLNM